MELLDAILTVTKCERAEQLKNLSPERKTRLAHSLEERVPSGLASIEEWNELLMLFMDVAPETENKIAKRKLLSYLRGKEYKEKNIPPSKSKWWRFEKNENKKNAN